MHQLLLEDVTKTYRIGDETIRAVQSASLAVDRGEFISIVGHSGSGKTTLLSVIGGMVTPTSGRVVFNGQDLGSLDRDGLAAYRAGKVGFMFQFASLLPMLNAKENLLLPVLFGPARDERTVDAKAVELLSMVGLADKLAAFPSQLSGGQQRRVAIARAFMNDPELILADEPTGDLDEETEAEIMGLFRKINEERNATFVFITHNRDLAQQAKRRLRMSGGIVQEL
ncbi:MAG: ABC transporter ATP-binding protein [Thermodesulfovibrionales bacterium]